MHVHARGDGECPVNSRAVFQPVLYIYQNRTFIKTERTSMAQTVMHAGADQEGEQQAEETRGIQQYLLKAVLNNTLKVTARDGSTR